MEGFDLHDADMAFQKLAMPIGRYHNHNLECHESSYFQREPRIGRGNASEEIHSNLSSLEVLRSGIKANSTLPSGK